jgi:hypothetical protein
MTERDEVAELADRLRAKHRRGEEPGLQFRLDFASFTDDERDEFVALMDERAAHGKEKLEALDEDNRALLALCDQVASSGAPPGTPLGQAVQVGYVSVLEVVESIRAVPDPLAE